MKKINRGLSSVGILSLSVLASLFLAVPPAHAQEATEPSAGISVSAAVTSTTSTASFKVDGNASAVKTGLAESVTFSGEVVITATVVTDPVLPPGVTIYIDGRGVKGIGNKSGIIYLNACQANLTRKFAPTDVIQLTFAFFEDAKGSYLKSKTGLMTINLTYDDATKKLTAASGVVGTL